MANLSAMATAESEPETESTGRKLWRVTWGFALLTAFALLFAWAAGVWIRIVWGFFLAGWSLGATLGPM